MTEDRRPDGPEDRRPSDDEAWDDIVARLRPDLPAAPPTDGGRQASEGQGSAPAPQEPPATTPPWPVLRPAPTEDEDPLPGDFVSPEPPPLFSGRPTLVLAACALLLPILALLLLAVLPVSPPGWGMLALVLVAVAGGVGLFLQLPRRGDGRGDRLDRGAQV